MKKYIIIAMLIWVNAAFADIEVCLINQSSQTIQFRIDTTNFYSARIPSGAKGAQCTYVGENNSRIYVYAGAASTPGSTQLPLIDQSCYIHIGTGSNPLNPLGTSDSLVCAPANAAVGSNGLVIPVSNVGEVNYIPYTNSDSGAFYMVRIFVSD